MFNQQQQGFMPGFGGAPMGTGFQFGGVQPQNAPKIKNNLTQEEIMRLVQKDNQFTLALTEVEKLRAACNHRWADGTQDSIVEDPVTGICTCQICGYQFEPIAENTDKETLEEYVKNILDVLQTIKLLYIEMPEDVAREFFMVIPLIEKIPKLFERACSVYNKYSDVNVYGYNNRNMNAMQIFNMLQGTLAGQPMGQPMAPNYGYAQAPYGSNGFVATGVDPNAYNPQTAGFQYNPGMMAQPQQPAPEAAPAAEATNPADATNFKA